MPNIADYLNKRDLETIGRFTATWAVFEQELFSKKCGMWKIRSVISEDEIADMTLQSLVQQLKNELFSYTNGTDECISALQFRNSETDENAKEQTHKWLNGEILCTYQLSIFIIFRIRCNMFHGEKCYGIYNSRSSFLKFVQIFLNSIFTKRITPIFISQN